MNTKTKKVTRTRLDHSLSWQTILYNCECHTFDEVIEQLMLAIKCTEATASQYAYIVHNLGSASVFKGEKEECERVSDILGSIGLNVKVTQ